jgi:hypothetical protein
MNYICWLFNDNIYYFVAKTLASNQYRLTLMENIKATVNINTKFILVFYFSI